MCPLKILQFMSQSVKFVCKLYLSFLFWLRVVQPEICWIELLKTFLKILKSIWNRKGKIDNILSYKNCFSLIQMITVKRSTSNVLFVKTNSSITCRYYIKVHDDIIIRIWFFITKARENHVRIFQKLSFKVQPNYIWTPYTMNSEFGVKDVLCLGRPLRTS